MTVLPLPREGKYKNPLPEKKNSGTVKPVNKVELEKKEPAKPEEVAKPVTNNVYERPATDSEKTEKVLPRK